MLLIPHRRAISVSEYGILGLSTFPATMDGAPKRREHNPNRQSVTGIRGNMDLPRSLQNGS